MEKRSALCYNAFIYGVTGGNRMRNKNDKNNYMSIRPNGTGQWKRGSTSEIQKR